MSQENTNPRKRNRSARSKKASRKELDVATELTQPNKIIKMNSVEFDPIIFQPMKTGKAVDNLLDQEGGVPRASNYIVIGDPGIGKSTVTLDIICDLAKTGHKVLFISGEMNRIDLYKYVQRYPKFGDIDILFMNEHLDENPKLVIETQLKEGYDVVLGDSFVEIQDTVKEALFLTSGATEKWIIDLMISHNMGGNDLKKYTTFLMIQQVTKGGNFVGSNKLKHNTTGMMEMRWTKSGEAYLEMNKNRRGPVNKRLYFKLDNPNDVYYDSGRFAMEENNRRMLNEENDELEKESDDFDNMFKETGVNQFIDDTVTSSAAGEMEEHAENMEEANSTEYEPVVE